MNWLSGLLVGSRQEVHVCITAILVPYKMAASMLKSYSMWSYTHASTQSIMIISWSDTSNQRLVYVNYIWFEPGPVGNGSRILHEEEVTIFTPKYWTLFHIVLCIWAVTIPFIIRLKKSNGKVAICHLFINTSVWAQLWRHYLFLFSTLVVLWHWLSRFNSLLWTLIIHISPIPRPFVGGEMSWQHLWV